MFSRELRLEPLDEDRRELPARASVRKQPLQLAIIGATEKQIIASQIPPPYNAKPTRPGESRRHNAENSLFIRSTRRMWLPPPFQQQEYHDSDQDQNENHGPSDDGDDGETLVDGFAVYCSCRAADLELDGCRKLQFHDQSHDTCETS